jgi:hypothetical protein
MDNRAELPTITDRAGIVVTAATTDLAAKAHEAFPKATVVVDENMGQGGHVVTFSAGVTTKERSDFARLAHLHREAVKP